MRNELIPFFMNTLDSGWNIIIIEAYSKLACTAGQYKHDRFNFHVERSIVEILHYTDDLSLTPQFNSLTDSLLRRPAEIFYSCFIDYECSRVVCFHFTREVATSDYFYVVCWDIVVIDKIIIDVRRRHLPVGHLNCCVQVVCGLPGHSGGRRN